MKVTVENESVDFRYASSPLLPPLENPSPKLTKTERKGRGAKKWNVVHQQLTTTKTDRSVSFTSLPSRAPLEAPKPLRSQRHSTDTTTAHYHLFAPFRRFCPD